MASQTVKFPALATLLHAATRHLGVNQAEIGRRLHPGHVNPAASVHTYFTGKGFPREPERLAAALEIPAEAVEGMRRASNAVALATLRNLGIAPDQPLPIGNGKPAPASNVRAVEPLRIAQAVDMALDMPRRPVGRPPSPATVGNLVMNADGTAEFGIRLRLPIGKALQVLGRLHADGLLPELTDAPMGDLLVGEIDDGH